jgi:hypothetical protein
MRVFRSLEEVRAAEGLEPGWRLALERVMGDLTSAYADAGLAYDPDSEGPVVLAEQRDTDEDWRNLMGCALSTAPFEGATIEHGCFVAVVLANNEYGYTIIVPDAPWLAPESLARLIDAMG